MSEAFSAPVSILSDIAIMSAAKTVHHRCRMDKATTYILADQHGMRTTMACTPLWHADQHGMHTSMACIPAWHADQHGMQTSMACTPLWHADQDGMHTLTASFTVAQASSALTTCQAEPFACIAID